MRRPATIAGGVLVLVLLLTGPAALVLLGRPDEGQPARQSVDTVHVAQVPTDIVATLGQLWVSSARERRLVSIYDADPPAVADSAPLGAPPLRLASDNLSVWATGAETDSLTRVLADDSRRPGTIDLHGEAVDVAVGPDAVWVTNGARGTVTRVDPVSRRRIGAPVRTGRFPTAVAVGDRFVWVVNSGDGTVARVDPHENLVMGRRLRVGRDPQDIAIGFGSVWVANRGDGTVTRLSSRTGRELGAPIRVGVAPSALAITRDAVLVLDSRPGALLRIDPVDGQVTRLAALGGEPSALALSASGAAWVTDARSGTVTRIR